VGEKPEQQDGREDEHGRQPTRDLRLGPGDSEDACEHVGIERALVVPERPEEQRQERAVLVSQAGRDGVPVVRECRLVAVVPRRVRRRDPQLKGHDREHCADAEQNCGPLHERAGSGAF
jgi:hypothetical protein